MANSAAITVESDLANALLERWLQSDEGLTAFLQRFLNCELRREEWTHRAHIGMCAALVLQQQRQSALPIIRSTIPRLNEAMGGINSDNAGYHETLTVFWVDRIDAVLRRLPQHFRNLDKVRAVVEAYGEVRRLDRAYYTFDVLASVEARKTWIPPDR